MIKPVPKGYRTVTPSIVVKDSQKAIKFYKKAFKAKELGIFLGPDGKCVMHATIKIGNSILMMADEQPQMASKCAETLGSSPISLWLYVKDADKTFAKAVKAGAVVTMPLADMFWGDRMGQLKDPFGYSWTVATHTKDMTEDEIKQAANVFFAQMAQK